MLGVDNVTETKKRCEKFWNKEFIGRPFLCLKAAKDTVEPYYNSWSYVKTLFNLKKGDYYSLIRDFKQSMQTRWFGGEAMPFFVVDTAPDLFATFFGGNAEGQEGEFTTWVSKIADEASELHTVLDKTNKTYLEFLNYVKLCADFAGDDFLIGVPDLHSNLDTLSALLGSENLCVELMMNPDAVAQKLSELNDAYPQIYTDIYHAGAMDKKGTIGWQPLYCAQKSAVVQCDFSCMISPEMARKYVIPSIEREAHFLDRSVYHYDGKGALGHFDDILAIQDIDVIQWVPGAGETRTIYWLDLLKKVQKAGKSVWVYDWTPEEILADTELIPELTMFELHFARERQAKEFQAKLEKKYK